MRDYGKIATRIWTDPKFLPLSKDAKLVFIYLIAGAETNAIGCFRCSPMNIAASEVCGLDEAQLAMTELTESGLVQYDASAKVVYIPNFLKYNPVCNISAGKAVVKAARQVPDTKLLAKAVEQLTQFDKHMPQGWESQLTHVPTQVSTHVSSTHHDTHHDTDTEGDCAPPRLPTKNQMKRIAEMADERGVSVDAVRDRLGLQQITSNDVTAVMEAIKEIPRRTAEDKEVEAKNAALRFLKAEVERIASAEGIAAARNWIKKDDHDKNISTQLYIHLQELEAKSA